MVGHAGDDPCRVADPENISERLTLYAAQRLAGSARDWAEGVREARADTPLSTIAEEVRSTSAGVARIDGAVAGTPFFIALVPGYLAYLLQEARMGLRIAALYGRDPATMRTAGEMMALRGMYLTPEDAEQALIAVRDAPPPEKVQERRPLRMWVRTVYRLLVFGGFMSPPKDKSAEAGQEDEPERSRLRGWIGIAGGTAIWLSTWVFPITFMVAMAWGCESHTRTLGRRVMAFYDGDAATPEAAIAAADRREDRGHDKRQILRTIALFLSVAIPIGFVAYADHVRQSTGINWIVALERSSRSRSCLRPPSSPREDNRCDAREG